MAWEGSLRQAQASSVIFIEKLTLRVELVKNPPVERSISRCKASAGKDKAQASGIIFLVGQSLIKWGFLIAKLSCIPNILA